MFGAFVPNSRNQGGSEDSELNPLLIIYFDKYHLK